MKMLLIVILTLFTVGCGYDGPAEVSGVWSRKNTFQDWKNGKNELIASTEVRIGSDVYLGLTNSVEINMVDENKYIAVPGGRWLVLRSEMMNKAKCKITVISMKNKNSHGEVLVEFVSPDEIYFVRGEMDATILDEMEQAFIFWNSKEIYSRCDRKRSSNK